MTAASLEDRLRELRDAREAEREAAGRREDRWGTLGVGALFVGATLWLVRAFGGPGPGGGVILGLTAGLVLALTLVRRGWSTRRERLSWSVEWIDRALSRLQDRWDFGQDDGHRFADPTHPYVADLGIFGSFSLFERLNACRTALGERRLARILDGKALGTASLAERQDAIRELRDRLEVRERAELAFRQFERSRVPRDPHALERITEELIAWGTHAADEPPHQGPPPVLHWTLAGVAVVGAGATLFAAAPWWVGAVPWAFNLWLLHRATWVGALASRFEVVEKRLTPWAGVLEVLEGSNFRNAELASLRARVAGSGASDAVRDLGRRARSLSQRRNLIWVVTGGALLLWDFLAARRLLRWRAEYGPDLGRWLDAAARFEALLCLAGYAAAVPDHVWPVESEDGPPLRATALAHPLLPADRRVSNDLDLDPAGCTWVVTGSNMSGKSTFLRAAGLGVVLARAGAPVPATAMALRPLSVMTSMIVTESLERGSSRFHAEVVRIRRCLDWVRQAEGGLVLLDEILSGTNSAERHQGTEAVIRTLTALGAVTLVSTHDLALADLEKELPYTRVVHFRDTIEDGRMTFDYVARPGVLPSTNALEVMRAEGIAVDPPA